MGKLLGLCLLLGGVGMPITPAHAEKWEYVAGVSGGGMFPGFASTQATDFTLAAWSGGVIGHFGVSKGLSLGLGFDIAEFQGRASNQHVRAESVDTVADLRFHGILYHPQLVARYKLVRGYDWAPYAQVGLGYLWAQYMEPTAEDPNGRDLGVKLDSFAEGSPTATVQLASDVRMFNFIMAGVGIAYTRVLDGMLEQFIHVPVTVTAYW